MPALVPVPKLGHPLQGRGKPQYGRNGKSAASAAEAVLGRGGGIHAHVITKKSYEPVQKDFDGLVPFDDPPKAEGVAKTSDAQLRHRKKINAAGTMLTSTLGLAALGGKISGAGLKQMNKAPRLAAGLDRAALPTSLTAGGIGGVNGYEHASIQRTESKRRGKVVTSSKAYDPEIYRARRNERQTKALEIGSAAAGAGAAAVAVRPATRGARKLFLTSGAKKTIKLRQPIDNSAAKTTGKRRPPRYKTVEGKVPNWGSVTGRVIRKLPKLKARKGSLAVVGALGATSAGLGAGSKGWRHYTEHQDSYPARYAGRAR